MLSITTKYSTYITFIFIMLTVVPLSLVDLTQHMSTQVRKIADHLYCEPSLCVLYNGVHTIQASHIGCQNNGNFDHGCGAQPNLLRMHKERRNLILSMHNSMRSRIALGKVVGYLAASRMPLLRWDNELEFLAELNVRRCLFEHDQCHNTPRFRYSGQNIGHFWISREFISHSKRMKSFIISWFKEHQDANQSFINSFHQHPEGKQIEHFTMMVADRAHNVGCAAIHYRDPYKLRLHKFLMTCNYDFSNLLMEPVYRVGPTASQCAPRAVSKRYAGLCD